MSASVSLAHELESAAGCPSVSQVKLDAGRFARQFRYAVMTAGQLAVKVARALQSLEQVAVSGVAEQAIEVTLAQYPAQSWGAPLPKQALKAASSVAHTPSIGSAVLELHCQLLTG